MRILLIGGDKYLLDEIVFTLGKDYVIDVANSGFDGTYLSQVNEYDVMIVETSVADIDGIEICKMTRSANINTPIILLIDELKTTEKVMSLDAGADVTISKPVDINELMAQIRALTRRNGDLISCSTLKIGDVEMDIKKRQIFVNGKPIYLRRKEFDLLEYLMINGGRIVSKEEILEHVWEEGIYIFSNTVEVHIRSIRCRFKDLINKDFIKTVRGFGYKIET